MTGVLVMQRILSMGAATIEVIPIDAAGLDVLCGAVLYSWFLCADVHPIEISKESRTNQELDGS